MYVGCRRKFILQHFGETPTFENCANCDNCCTKHTSRDFTFEVELLLSAVVGTNQRFGLGMPIDVLRGSKNQKLVDKKFDKLPIYAKGHHISDFWWKSFSHLLLAEGFLQEVNEHKFKLVKLAPKGSTFLMERKSNKPATISATFAITKELEQAEAKGKADARGNKYHGITLPRLSCKTEESAAKEIVARRKYAISTSVGSKKAGE